jgi:quercetin dioxygenase-like cupin family protein
MAALPSPLDSRIQPGRAAGIGATTLGALVAVGVAALFLALIGANRTDRLARPGATAHANRATTQGTQAIPCLSQAVPLFGHSGEYAAYTSTTLLRTASGRDTNQFAKGEEMKSKWIWALLLGVLGSAVYAGDVLATAATTPPAPTTTILGQSRFDSFRVDARQFLPDWRARLETRGLSDVYVVDNKFPPGATTGWHAHPGPSLILVLAGTVTNYTSDDPTCSGQTYSTGSGFIDPGGRDVHTLTNNGTTPAETIAVQILPKDAPRKTPEPPPANCH